MQILFFTILQLYKTGFLILQKTSGACLPPFVAAFQLIFWHTEQSQIPFVSAGSPRTPTISSMFSHLISLNLFIYPRALVVGSGLVPDVHSDSMLEAQTSPLRLVHHVRAPFPSSPNPWITLRLGFVKRVQCWEHLLPPQNTFKWFSSFFFITCTRDKLSSCALAAKLSTLAWEIPKHGTYLKKDPQ